ncbi:MAG: hypothetical protein RMY29_004215 [Nostoc sp. CreGUA01]
MGIGHWALGIGHWALGIGHWVLIFSPCYCISPTPHSPFPIPLNGGREYYTSFGGEWFS